MYSSRLPSTSSLRAFESAARYLTCSGAADELCITQSAVSKQIKCLEAALGVAVFDRRAHGLQLTTAGAKYLGIARTVLRQLETAQSEHSRSEVDPEVLYIRIPPSLGEKWLLPRLPRFLQEHPNVSVHFAQPLGRLEGALPDLEIRFGHGQWNGVRSRYLGGSDLALVASPRLFGSAGDAGGLGVPWRYPRLIHFQAEQHWSEVSSEFPELGNWSPRAMRYGYYSVLLEAAASCIGIALVPRLLASKALMSGRIIEPLALNTRSSLGYHLIETPSSRVSSLAYRFAEWLLLEVRNEPSLSTPAVH